MQVTEYDFRVDLGPYPMIEATVNATKYRVEQTPAGNVLYVKSGESGSYVLSAKSQAEEIVATILDVAKRYNLATAIDWPKNRNTGLVSLSLHPL
jgi:hypothetical protein